MDYRTIKRPSEVEIVINKSRFIGRAFPVDSEQRARDLLEQTRKKHYDASHNCYAYRMLDGTARFSDDGEPGGTAGLPMMEVLLKRDVRDVMVIVTRYFGGVLLGAGGLVRAYTQSAAQALGAAGIVEMLRAVVYELELPYQYYDRLCAFFKDRGYEAEKPEFAEGVRLQIAVEHTRSDEFERQLIDQFEGRLVPKAVSEQYMPFELRE